MRFGLVLGAGGTVGVAYHVGVLRALERYGGIDPAKAELIVGTSAGSVVAAQLRSGWTTSELWDFAMGVHPLAAHAAVDEADRRSMFTPGWASPFELARRTVGAAFVLGRSLNRFPMPQLPSVLGRLYPGGLFTMAEGRRRLEHTIAEEWPTARTWLVAVDLASGKRVVLGRPGSPRTTLRRAVLASCAIPGVYEPVRVGACTLVDGGAHSSTNLDLAAQVDGGLDLVIGVAPMAYEPRHAPGPLKAAGRLLSARNLSSETDHVRRVTGTEVLLVRPSATELRIHGTNLMRAEGVEHVATAAYASTVELLRTERFQRVLGANVTGAVGAM